MTATKTKVAIIGAGPAGLLLAQLLHNAGIESVIFEAKSEDYVVERVRAGVLEQGAVDTLIEAGVGDRLQREGMPHDGILFRFDGKEKYVDVNALTNGSAVTVYGQKYVVQDLINQRRTYGDILFNTPVTQLTDLQSARPKVQYEKDGETHILECDYVAGCDGFWGVSRASIPAEKKTIVEHVYPYSWFSILANSKPANHVVIYSLHENGFALASMRSENVSRHYFQCPNDEDITAWSDDQIWDELELRLKNNIDGFTLPRGEITQRGITPLRSYVCETMRYGNLFLAGDAAHIVPPTGAKGMNLAIADIRVLAAGLIEKYNTGQETWLEKYEKVCLDRIWKMERFSWWVTSTFHKAPKGTEFDLKMQQATLSYLTSSEIGAASFAENYVGLPFAI